MLCSCIFQIYLFQIRFAFSFFVFLSFLLLCLSFFRILHLHTPSKIKTTKKQTNERNCPRYSSTQRYSAHLLIAYKYTSAHFLPRTHPPTHKHKITLPHKWIHSNTYSTYSVVAQITTSPSQCVVMSADPNGNHSGIDSGYAPSNMEDAVAGTTQETPPESPQHRKRTDSSGTLKRSSLNKRNGIDGSPKREAVR